VIGGGGGECGGARRERGGGRYGVRGWGVGEGGGRGGLGRRTEEWWWGLGDAHVEGGGLESRSRKRASVARAWGWVDGRRRWGGLRGAEVCSEKGWGEVGAGGGSRGDEGGAARLVGSDCEAGAVIRGGGGGAGRGEGDE